jgi:hypothetical protein
MLLFNLACKRCSRRMQEVEAETVASILRAAIAAHPETLSRA